MQENKWQELLLPKQTEDYLWELFHENSKIGRYGGFRSDEEVIQRMQQLHESLPFPGYPEVDLPQRYETLPLSLEEAIRTRTSARNMRGSDLTLGQLATILHYAYGISRPNLDSHVPRSFRMVPSAGALYPLELFFHSSHVTDLTQGLYHYNPMRNSVRLLRAGDETQRIAAGLIQPDLAENASLIIFMTAIFERSTFKYGERGYRFVFLEAGHVAQNINLISNCLGLASINIGGYRDREIDDYIELDGLNQSTIYIVAIGSFSR